MAQSAEAMLEASKWLIIIKENEPNGTFTSIVIEQLGMAYRIANLIMNAALKYTSSKPESKVQSLAVLGKIKLFKLIIEGD
ncbi:MAG: hypothetical protein ACTXOO_00595 [Sodalis sp. (in: enterobacteria)]